MTLAIKPSSPVLQANQYATGLRYFAVMHEGSGTTVHDLGSSAKDAAVGAGVWGTGQFTGPDLNIAGVGTNGVILDDTSPVFKPPGDFSLSAWVNLTNVTANHQCIMGYYCASGSNIYCWVVGVDPAVGKAKFFTGDGTSSPSTSLSATTLPLNTWTHIVWTYTASGSVATCYLNGVQDAQVSGVAVPTYRTLNEGVGLGSLHYIDGSQIQPVIGQLDAVALYGYALPLSGGANDSVAGIFADPFRAVRTPSAPATTSRRGIKWIPPRVRPRLR